MYPASMLPLEATALATLVQHMPIGLFVIRDGLIVWSNDHFATFCEGTPEQIQGQGFVGLVAPEDRPFVLDRYRRRLAGEAVPDEYEFSILGAATERRTPVHMVVRVVVQDGVRHSIGVVADAHAQAQLAAGLAPTDRRLAAAPVLRVAPGVLVVPLVGRYHAARVHNLTSDVLAAVQRQQAHTLILDVTGLVDADARVADYLSRAAAAVRLLGTRCVLAGVTPALAQVLVASGASLGGLTTVATLEDALRAG